MKLKDFIPFIRISRFHPQRSLTEYQSYETASQDSDTYGDPRVVEMVSRKTEAYRDALLVSTGAIVKTRQTIQNMFAISYVEPARPLEVLELGGACGASYFELNRMLPGRIKSWSVVETPLMAAAGRRLFQDNRLKFFEDLEAAVAGIESPDLIIAQGVLQCTSSPQRIFDSLLGLGFKYIYVTRTTVTVGADEREGPTFTKQITSLSEHGPGALPPDLKDQRTTQPLVLIPYGSLASRLLPDYRLLFRFDESEESSVLIGAKTVTTKDMGFLAVKEGL